MVWGVYFVLFFSLVAPILRLLHELVSQMNEVNVNCMM